LRHVVDDENEREGGKQLKQLGRLINTAQQYYLGRCPQRSHDQRGANDAAPEPERPAHGGCEGIGEIQAHHVERTVGDVDDAGDAENEREPAPTKNRLDAVASPLSAWNRTASRLI
jgi:hypothetical protein